MPSAAHRAPPVALFVSDVHLHPEAPRTALAFLGFLREQAASARQLYLLGDLFEFWVGDDEIDAPFNAGIVSALRTLADAGLSTFWMAGNRDFLAGERFAAAAGLTILADPTVVTIAGQQIVLTHGDVQCTDDVDYQAFRKQVRNPSAQQAFLALPIAQRHAMIASFRHGSRAAQRDKTEAIMDVNPEAIQALFAQTGTKIMIHGHTHRPAAHVADQDGTRYRRFVLSDWDCEGDMRRGGGLVIDADGAFSTLSLG